jgi:hypothetical protein
MLDVLIRAIIVIITLMIRFILIIARCLIGAIHDK